MSWRPETTRWFEALLPRLEAARAVAALARTGRVELEPEAGTEATPTLAAPTVAAIPARFQALCRNYGRYWGDPEPTPSWSRDWRPEEALARIESWRRAADPHILRLQDLQQERSRLTQWRRLLHAVAATGWDPALLLAEPGPVLGSLVAVLPIRSKLPIPASILYLTFPIPIADDPAHPARGLFLIGPAAPVGALHHELRLAKGRALSRPIWLQGPADEALTALDRRLRVDEEEIERLRRVLATLGTRYALPAALAQLHDLTWFLARVGPLPGGPRLTLVRGWTDAVGGIGSDHPKPCADPLVSALAEAGVHALVHYPPAPAGVEPPLRLANPRWARPFEVFTRLLGPPAREAVDPSRLLALVFPFLFGYMFGDVGQGVLLMVLGLLARRRLPVTEILVPAGGFSILFGLLFGSVFGLEGLLPALWLHPLAHPLTVLALPLAFGAGLLWIGLVLDGFGAAWRGRGRAWWSAEAGLLLCYPAALGALFAPALWWAAALGAAWVWWGRARREEGLRGLFGGLGETLEDAMRLLVGTISFARVGAFALAHAGLSAALEALALGTGSILAAAVILVLGNLLVIGLETLVVSVQGTRLMLFEFFTRFFRVGGRPFRPLAVPAAEWQSR